VFSEQQARLLVAAAFLIGHDGMLRPDYPEIVKEAEGWLAERVMVDGKAPDSVSMEGDGPARGDPITNLLHAVLTHTMRD